MKYIHVHVHVHGGSFGAHMSDVRVSYDTTPNMANTHMDIIRPHTNDSHEEITR